MKKGYKAIPVDAWIISAAEFLSILSWCGATEYSITDSTLVLGDTQGGIGDYVVKDVEGNFSVWEDVDWLKYNALTDGYNISALRRPSTQSVNMTEASAGSTGITIADNANLDFGTGNFAIAFTGALDSWEEGSLLVQKWVTNVGYKLSILAATGRIQLKLNTADYFSSEAPDLEDGTSHTIVAVGTVGITNTTVDFYVDGEILGVQQTALNPGTVSNAAAIYFLGDSAARTAGQVSFVALFSRALTESEVLDLYRNGINYTDKWASSSAVYTSNFSATDDGWTASAGAVAGNVDGIAGEDDWLSLTVDNTNAEHYTEKALGLTVGKKYTYNYKFFLPGTNTAVNGLRFFASDGVTPYSNILGGINLPQSGSFLVDDVSQGVRIYLYNGGDIVFEEATGTDVAYVKGIVVTEEGARLALQPEGIQIDKWYDASSNGLNASYPVDGASLVVPLSARTKQPTPTAETTGAVTLTIARLLTGIITGTPDSPRAYTLDTGANIDALNRFNIGDFIDWVIINNDTTAINIITVTAAADHTVVGVMDVAANNALTGALWGNSARFRTVKTGVATYVTYRV